MEDRLLRSLIDVNREASQEDLARNFAIFEKSRVLFDDPDNKAIWDVVRNWYESYREIPSIAVLEESFAKQKKKSLLRRLDVIQMQSPVYYSEFEHLTKQVFTEQQEIACQQLLRKASLILTEGVMEKEGRNETTYKGSRDAISYIMMQAEEFLRTDSGAKTQGEITADADEIYEQAERAWNSPQDAWGMPSGIKPIDDICRGAKKGELWLHAASTGELKSTFAMNWAYKLAFLYRYNVAYISLEMSYEQIRLRQAIMHSSNPKFIKQGWIPLCYRSFRDGAHPEGIEISEEEKEYFRYLMDDMGSGEYGKFHINSATQQTIPMIQRFLETKHRQDPIHFVVLDHLGLVTPVRRTGNFYTDINTIMRGAKELALHFNDGEGIPVLGLLQINRKGKEEADKNQGRYKTQALADANEAERSADVISYTYLNQDLRNTGQTLVGCMKNRDNPWFEPFYASVYWDTMYVGHDISDSPDIMPSMSILEDNLFSLDGEFG